MKKEKTNLNARVYKKRDEYLIYLENRIGETVDIIAVEKIDFINLSEEDIILIEKIEASERR